MACVAEDFYIKKGAIWQNRLGAILDAKAKKKLGERKKLEKREVEGERKKKKYFFVATRDFTAQRFKTQPELSFAT